MLFRKNRVEADTADADEPGVSDGPPTDDNQEFVQDEREMRAFRLELEGMAARDIELTTIEFDFLHEYNRTRKMFERAMRPGSVKNRIRRAGMSDLEIAHVNALRENKIHDASAGWREEYVAQMHENALRENKERDELDAYLALPSEIVHDDALRENERRDEVAAALAVLRREDDPRPVF